MRGSWLTFRGACAAITFRSKRREWRQWQETLSENYHLLRERSRYWPPGTTMPVSAREWRLLQIHAGPMDVDLPDDPGAGYKMWGVTVVICSVKQPDNLKGRPNG